MTFNKCFFKVFLLLISILNTPSAYTKTAQTKPISAVVSTSDTTNKVQWLDKDLQPTANKSKATYLLAEAKKVDNGYRLVITHLDNQPYYQTNVDTLNLDKANAIGPYKTYFRSGELKVEGQRNNDGLHTGIKTYYAKDGHKVREKTYKNGELNGAYKTYNGQGKLLVDRTMSDGKQEGVERGYFPNGQLMHESEYKNDEQHGLAKRWDSKGNLLRKSYFVNGRRDGTSTQYFEDGTVKKIQEYKNGKRIGKTTLYYADGSLKYEEIRNDKAQVISYRGYSKAGLLTRSQEHIETDNGLIEERKWFNDSKQLTRLKQEAVDNSWRLHESYDENGNIRDRREVKNQQLSGLYIARRRQGLEKVKYLKGKRHGTYTVTDSDGNVTSQGEYKYGKKVGKWIISGHYGTLKEHYNKDGKLTGVRERHNEKGELTLREHYKSGEKNGQYLEYKDGKLVVKGQYIKGRRQGEWLESQGYAPYRAVKGRYQNGVRVGKWRIYSPNGYLRGIEYYNNEGLLDGLLVTFSQEGALAEVVQYKNDRMHGKSWSYKSGKPFAITVYEQGEMKKTRYKDEFKLSEFP